jgi:hypothetical protein
MKYMPFLLVALVFAPHVGSSVRFDGSRGFALTRPRICSGDEPHYLIQVNSLLHDGDLDLADNYARVSFGAAEAGERFRSASLEHHVNWYIDGRLVHWHDVFRPDGSRKPGTEGMLVPNEEYSQHPPGLPILLAIALFPLPDYWVESGSLFVSGLAVALGLYWFCELIRPYANSRLALYSVAAVAFFGTPALAYGRTMFTEPYLLACAIGSLYFYLRTPFKAAGEKGTVPNFAPPTNLRSVPAQKWGQSPAVLSPLVAGALIGLGIAMKPPFAVLMLPMFVETVLRKRWSTLASLCVGPGIAVAFILALNQCHYGSCFRSSQQWDAGISLAGVAEILVDKEHGILWFAPAIVLAALATPSWSRQHRRDATILLCGVAAYFIVMAPWGGGGYCYATRYLVPICPLMMVPLTALPTMRIWKIALLRWAVYAVCVLSIAINVVGAMEIEGSWSQRPLHFLTNGWLW